MNWIRRGPCWFAASRVCTCCLTTLMFYSVALPVASDPLYGRDLSPLSGLFGFPLMRNAAALEKGQWGGEVVTSIANNYSAKSNALESVNFDGEFLRVASRVRYGFGRGWEIEAELPWQQNDGGKLDASIENWHDLWNLPDGDRDEVARDLYDISYSGPGAGFSFTDDASGLGDASLALVKELYRTQTRAISARLGTKFASGDEDDLLGSGSEDYYLSINFTGAHRGDLPLVWNGQLGYMRAGDTDLLGDIQEQDLWFAGIGLEWAAWESVHLKMQVDSHAAVTDSSLTQMGDTSIQLTTGLTWLFARNWELDAAFTEDIAVDTAPDFGLQLALRYRSEP